ncbi:helix-turn-helix domain-containing protein [Streptomyces turgidiscabies]|uniref:Transcriptional regulator, Fis family n=1 Tax=Streptomyces turgidiscabies (strain Car8) TaxID=698760 RepID=L7EZD8_STRT8|nr:MULTISPECIES: helix-turn-helix domain-containing protein [Streptomyces]ELP64076.1 transcriptional regulator, Fis family [Streptomyces turgidiscabies Car8]MDX3491605.1 helix-turn-helix domain-containing protein [Streptomyces turgidiscabies]GAQ73210.1 arginine utilization regulatory protein RocR [Streptomyces turgidiscabies]
MTTAEESPALLLLSRARQRFLSGRPLPDDVPDETVAAWRRARFLGVRHDVRQAGSFDGRAFGSALLAAARPVLERLAPALGVGTALLLTDERLRVLWAEGGAPGVGLRRDLAEREVGHNSAALALRLRRRAEVHGPEHFLDVWQDVSAVSVPVFAPESGRPLGTITVASELCAGPGPHPGAALAEAAAAAVEAELLAGSRSAERALVDAYARAARVPEGEHGGGSGGGRERAVVALDGRGRLVSEAAVRLVSPQVLESLERAARALLQSSAPVSSYDIELPEGAGCSAEFRPVRERGGGRVVGIVAVLEADTEMAVTRPAVRAVPRPAAGRLAGSSVPWLHAVGRAVELAGGSEPLLLTGERGSGKTALARELLGDAEPLVLDAAEEPELGLGGCELTGDRSILLRHAERLAQSDVAALNGLLDERPDVHLLVTYTPGTPPGPCFQRLLDTLAARSVVLPALRERPEDIRELLPALAPRPADGTPPLTWTLDALRALERYPWPGNVTELAHLVRTLADNRRASGPVGRAELPDPVREGPAVRPLSPMEHAERTAILETLRRNGGNKARTATALGIARATLYRKLREYGA